MSRCGSTHMRWPPECVISQVISYLHAGHAGLMPVNGTSESMEQANCHLNTVLGQVCFLKDNIYVYIVNFLRCFLAPGPGVPVCVRRGCQAALHLCQRAGQVRHGHGRGRAVARAQLHPRRAGHGAAAGRAGARRTSACHPFPVALHYAVFALQELQRMRWSLRSGQGTGTRTLP